MQAWQERDIAVLARVPRYIKVQIVERLTDGSAVIQVPVKEEQRIVDSLRLREIQVTGSG